MNTRYTNSTIAVLVLGGFAASNAGQCQAAPNFSRGVHLPCQRAVGEA